MSNDSVDNDCTSCFSKTELVNKDDQDMSSSNFYSTEKLCQSLVPPSELKSSAVVKYAARSPSDYCQLEKHTDLNSPPVNWLRGSFAVNEPWMPGGVGAGKSEYSSFLMVNNSIDSIGKVDVISNSENIKKLLKMPYSGSQISMLVHRIGKTIMIDDFDVYKHVLRQQQNDWQWLRKFIMDEIIAADRTHENALISVPAATREEVNEKLMLSKFLYHSIVSQPDIQEHEYFGSPRRSKAPVVPDPLQTEVPSAHGPQTFERQVLWTFEDIRMLIGSDVPIFGGGTHPCISLRLSDMRKPINILTGLDYWLDQLMCNVPEVLMCYHLEGFVQQYELHRTEDLPVLSETPFSQELIRDVAQNILSFLKNDAAKEGHTYWLFKANDDDVVKLYDLTTICSDYLERDLDDNPFTLPVAILMYRVARNLSEKYPRKHRKTASTIYKLLTECLEILNRGKYPQIVGSINFLISNLYLNYGLVCNLRDGSANLDDSTEEDDFDPADWLIDDPKSTEVCSCISLYEVMKAPSEQSGRKSQQGNEKLSSPSSKPCRVHSIPNSSSLESCCIQALEHIYEGIECAEVIEKRHNSDADAKLNDKAQCSETYGPRSTDQSTYDDGKDTLSSPHHNPNEPIVLDFEPLEKSDIKSVLLPLSVRFPLASAWQVELIALLLSKAMRAYLLLSECSMKLANYGRVLRYLKLANYCYESCMMIIGSVETLSKNLVQCKATVRSMIPDVLMFCGDGQLHLAQEPINFLPRHRSDLSKKVYRDERILAKAKKFLGDSVELKNDSCYQISDSIENHIQLSLQCYEASMKELRTAGTTNTKPAMLMSAGHQSDKKDSASIGQDSDMSPGSLTSAIMLSSRIGNAKNILAIYYKNLSTALLKESTEKDVDENETVQALWQKSYGGYQEGIKIFQKINDSANVALLNSNCGQLMRLCAHAYAHPGQELSHPKERQYLLESIDLYQRAVESVDCKVEPAVWESVVWELSGAYFHFATTLQERPPLSLQKAEDIEREVAEYMQKSLRLVENLESVGNPKRHDIYAYRMAIIHHKLASMYHRAFRAKDATDRRQKQLKTLTELHFSKATELYKQFISLNADEYIGMQLERVFLCEFIAENSAGSASKLKSYNLGLALIVRCSSAFMALCRLVQKQSSQRGAYRRRVASPASSLTSDASNLVLDEIVHSGLTEEEGQAWQKRLLEEAKEKRAEETIESRSAGRRKGGRGTESGADAENSQLQDHEDKAFLAEVERVSRYCYERLQGNLKSILVILRATPTKKSSGEDLLTLYKRIFGETLVKKPSSPHEWPLFMLKLTETLAAHDVWSNTA